MGRKQAEPRLDPVRWRRPRRGTLLRLAAVAVLLGTAAVISWSGSPPAKTCVAPPAPTAAVSTAAPGQAPGQAPAVPAGSVGVPVRLAEPTALTLVHPGDRIDLLSVDQSGGSTEVAAAALVLGVTGADDPTTGGLLVALDPTEAKQAVAASGRAFAILIRPD
jgi:hypothetical protein